MKKQKTRKFNTNKGITLIALVITIIVMLILVAVTISMAVNGGLFEYAGKATGDTNNAIREEQQLASGKVTIDNKVYNSIDEYLNRNNKTEPEGPSEIVIAESDVVQEGDYNYDGDECYAYIPTIVSTFFEPGKTYHLTYDEGFGLIERDIVSGSNSVLNLETDLGWYEIYARGGQISIIRHSGNMDLEYIKITTIE